jgi:IclR family pca regulon transcriptional regulator
MPAQGTNRKSQKRALPAARSAPGPPLDFAAFQGSPDFVLSLARGLQVIEAFETNKGGLSVADVSRLTGLSPAAVRRVLLTLEVLGYAESDGRSYRLKPRILRLGYSYLSSGSIAQIAEPVLLRAAEALHEAVALCVLEGMEVVYLAHCGTRRVMSVGVSVGTRLPAYCTSGGRVLLAALPDREFRQFLRTAELRPKTPKTVTEKRVFAAMIEKVRVEGFALVDEELEPGLRSLAVPVRSRQNVVVAAMNTGVQAARISHAAMTTHILPVLRESARILGQQIG